MPYTAAARKRPHRPFDAVEFHGPSLVRLRPQHTNAAAKARYDRVPQLRRSNDLSPPPTTYASPSVLNDPSTEDTMPFNFFFKRDNDTITSDKTVDTSPSEDPPTIEDDCPKCDGEVVHGVCLDCRHEDERDD